MTEEMITLTLTIPREDAEWLACGGASYHEGTCDWCQGDYHTNPRCPYSMLPQIAEEATGASREAMEWWEQKLAKRKEGGTP